MLTFGSKTSVSALTEGWNRYETGCRTQIISLIALRPIGDAHVRVCDGINGLSALECLSSLQALGLHLLLKSDGNLCRCKLEMNENKSWFSTSWYEGCNFNFGNAAVTFDAAHLQSSYFHRPSMYSPELCRTRSQR